jgi:hypothetical protein
MMEEIPLTTPRKHIKTQEEINYTEWKTLYKRALIDAKDEIDEIVYETKWNVLPKKAKERIKVYISRDNEWLFKIEGELQCNGERVIKIHTDTDYVTRSKWDIKELLSMEERETYITTKEDKFKVIQFIVGPTGVVETFLGKPFHVLGLQWIKNYPQDRETRCIFRTCNHTLFTHGEGQVPTQILSSLHVKHLEPNRCFVRFVLKVKPESQPLAYFKTKYRRYIAQRLYLYELIAQNRWEELYGKEAQETREKERREK